MEQARRLPDDCVRIFLYECQADHAGHKNCSICTFCIAVNMAEPSRHFSGDIRHARRQRSVNIAAELWSDSPPKLVVFGMTRVWRRNPSLQQQQRLFTSSPMNPHCSPATVVQALARLVRFHISRTPGSRPFRSSSHHRRERIPEGVISRGLQVVLKRSDVRNELRSSGQSSAPSKWHRRSRYSACDKTRDA